MAAGCLPPSSIPKPKNPSRTLSTGLWIRRAKFSLADHVARALLVAVSRQPFEITRAKRVGHRLRNFGFGQKDLGPVQRNLSLHLLLERDRVGPPLLGERLSLSRVRLGLIC